MAEIFFVPACEAVFDLNGGLNHMVLTISPLQFFCKFIFGAL